MSLSLCLIGNSHIAAIKQAWTNRKPAVADGVSLSFFSASVRLLENFELEGDVLIPKDHELLEKIRYTSDGIERIELSRYDAFLLFGMGFGFDVPNYCDGLDLATGSRDVPEGMLVSRPVFTATVEAKFEECYAVTLIDTIKSVTAKPMLLCGAPFLSERVLEDEEDLAAQARYRDMAFLQSVMTLARQAGENIAARHRCELLWQADSTVGLPGFTRKEFGINPVRFTMKGGKPPPVDRRHGNEEYGLIMLTAALQRMNEMTGGRLLPGVSA
ncbi:MAG TPA: hypothetical protein VMF58_09710 [Rhizomicrobium sp.]|nr:hypothetical protein [Rhizomicrobium sp.]